MRLKKPIITIILIILLVFTLVFFSLTLISKNIIKKAKMAEMFHSFNIQEHINDDDIIANSINNYYYPKEIFTYIDYKQLNEIEDMVINNLHNNKEIVVKEETINNLLMNSVSKYDAINKKDSTIYVEKDINEYSKRLSNIINNDLKDIYNVLLSFSNSAVVILLFISSILIMFFIIKNEKYNGVLISSISLFFYSFLLYYFDNNLIRKICDNQFFKYFSNYKLLKLDLDFTYIICFILSFVLLLIYIVEVIKSFVKNIRLNS